MTRRIAFLSMVLATALLSSACGGSDDSGSEAGEDQNAEPITEESFAEPPLSDTVPLEDAKKGDLIELPAYPLVGMYTGTKDVSGLDDFEMSIPLINNVRAFKPSVLIGSPGQEVQIKVLEEKFKGLSSAHDFRVADTPDFSSDHEVVGETWQGKKGTTFTLTFPDEGSVSFYCSYHVRINMAGILTVE